MGGHDTLVGHCVNMLPVRARVHGAQKFTELLAILRKAVLDAYEHQEFTFGTLLKKLPITRDPSRLPLVQVIFNVDRGMGPETMLSMGSPPSCSRIRGPSRISTCSSTRSSWAGRSYSSASTTPISTIASPSSGASPHSNRFSVPSPRTQPARSATWPSSPRTRLPPWHAGTNQHNSVRPVRASMTSSPLRLHARRRRLRSRSIGALLAYAELERRAIQVARRLRSLGVKRGDFVGLCIERSFDMFVGLYGALKAGAAYVPLDPGYPLERLTYMVAMPAWTWC